MTTLVDVENDITLIENLIIANDAWSKTKGLLGKDNISENEGLLIRDCSLIHMFFMKFPIDVIYLSSNYEVKKIVSNLKPWLVSGCSNASHTLEIAVGQGNKFKVGMIVKVI